MTFAAGNIFVRSGELRRGETIRFHKHNFDHLTLVACGRIEVTRIENDGSRTSTIADPESAEFNGVLVKAGMFHELACLTARARYWCVFAHRNPQGEVVREFTGWPDAYN